MQYDFLFDELAIDTRPFALCELQGRCDLGLERDPVATLHYVLSGEGELSIAGIPALPVSRGSLILVPAMRAHVLRSFGNRTEPTPTCRPADMDLHHLLRKIPGGISGPSPGPSSGTSPESRDSRMIALCAHVSVGLGGVHCLIDLIREPLAIHAPEAGLAAPLAGMLEELSRPRTGSRAMIRSLLLQCMIALLRDRLEAGDRSMAWMQVLKDRALWQALRRMLDAPGDDHSLESLAGEAGMSRSTFAARFTESCGKGPMELLREMRMHLAARLLTTTDLPVKRIAETVGFRSRSAFTRSFENVTGSAPGSYRSAAEQPDKRPGKRLEHFRGA